MVQGICNGLIQKEINSTMKKLKRNIGQRVSCISFVLLVLIMSGGVAYGEGEKQAARLDFESTRMLAVSHTGLLYSLPEVCPIKLMGEIKQLDSELRARQVDLQRSLDENSLTAKDAVIIALLPGGLIYGAIKKQQAAEKKRELIEVAMHIELLAATSSGFNVSN